MNINPKAFHPLYRTQYETPTLLFVNDIALEKDLETFLNLPDDLGKKTMINYIAKVHDDLVKNNKDVLIKPYKSDNQLAAYMASADVIVNPSSRQSLFQANFCGTPAASTNRNITKYFITDFVNGVINEDLVTAIVDASTLDRHKVREYAEAHFE